MLEFGADVHILGRQQEQNTSPSHRESRHGHRDLVEFVLKHHIDVHIQKRKGEIPLDGAPRNEEPKPADIATVWRNLAMESWTIKPCRQLRDTAIWISPSGYRGAVTPEWRSCGLPYDNDGRAPSYLASSYGHLDVV